MNDLDSITKQISALAAALTASAKTKNPVQQADELKKALKTARSVDWDKFAAAIQEALGTSTAETVRLLAERRQKMLEAVKAKGLHFRSEAEVDTVDVFKVRYKGPTAIIEFAGVEVDASDELDGPKLADTILATRSRLEKGGLDRAKFFSLVKAAITHADAKNPSRDHYIDIPSIYREMLFEQAWSKSNFAKSGSAKHFPEYPFYQFLWDLAAFVGGGNREGDMRLAGRTPAMSERATSYLLPNLNQPQAQGEVLHMLRIQKVQE
ncbi:MAG: hypothetical protein J0M04_06800 [Verrucomicrobia bacterium]|nr:hypothetical protein [Verrucomicrobiota bacterium]